ncbi:MAG: hypothetical protein IMF06_06280 [Proteobacteria bacterium]|nr:hypothetical protein [Pseudomonadota bacterium]
MATEANKDVKKVVKKVKVAAKKTAVKGKTAAKKVAAKKPAARKAAPKKKAAKKSTNDFTARAQETGRKAFLASLGFYGKAFDQVQDQFSDLQDQLEARRKKANKTYADLVKRGEKVEKATKSRIDDIEMPEFKLESLTDRKKLEAQLDKAKARFTDLKDTLSFKTAA